MAVVVAQLAEQLLPISEVCSLNPVIGKIYIELIILSTFIEKTKIKKILPGMAHFLTSILIKNTEG